jgi:hypothetical protein
MKPAIGVDQLGPDALMFFIDGAHLPSVGDPWQITDAPAGVLTPENGLLT